MIIAFSNPVAHTGEDQSSSEFAARSAHWVDVQAGVTATAGAVLAGVEPRVWSVTDEDFDAETLSNLIIANDWLRAGDIVYSAEKKSIKLSDLASADDIVLLMSERASKLAGAAADGYPRVSEAHKRILDGALRGWMALCCPPEFFGVENIQPHKVTDADLNAAARLVIGGAG